MNGNHEHDDIPSLAELATEANHRRLRRRKADRNPMNNAPWYIQIAVKFGLAGLIALMLVNWLTATFDKKLDLTLAAATATKVAQESANKEMTSFARESLRQMEISLLVGRQTCANGAKTDDARDRCYVTKDKQ